MTVERTTSFTVNDITGISVECQECKVQVVLPQSWDLIADAKCPGGHLLWNGNYPMQSTRDLVRAVLASQKLVDPDPVRFEVREEMVG